MKNEGKTVVVSIVILVLFFVSFVLFMNDLINYSMITISLTILCMIVLFINIFTKKDAHSNYVRKLKQILKTYDSDIVYSDEEYIITEKDVFFVKEIDDLIKASNELESPIIYFGEETSSNFIVKSDDVLLVYILKENEDVTDYEHYILKHIENTTGSKKVVLNNITEETIIKLGEKFYKITPMKNQFGMVYY